MLLYDALTMTIMTRVLNHLTRSATMWTGLLNSEESLLNANLTMSTTGRTSHRLCARFGPGTITGFTFNIDRYANFRSRSSNSFFQRQIQAIAQIGSTEALSTRTATAENIIKYIAKNIAETARTSEPATA